MRRVVVPRFPGALSALGLLLADVRKDYSRTLLVDAERYKGELKSALAELHRAGQEELQAEGFKKREIQSMDFVDLRYRGQSYELTLKLELNFTERFHEAHERRYGYANRGRPIELVNVRSTFIGRTKKPEFKKSPRQRGRPVPVERQPVWIDHKRMRTSIYDRSLLRHGHVIKGPAIIGEYSSTTLVPPDFRCVVDGYLNLVLENSGTVS
jgi:N-methylhydantoinase A